MSTKKSIFRGPNTQNFQLVHRSQRDPLINDDDVPDRVLAPFEPRNRANKKGKSKGDLDAEFGNADSVRANEGEAALYDIFYDDTEYDYMQHLRPVGGLSAQEEDSTFFVEAPKGQLAKRQAKGKGRAIELVDEDKIILPPDTLAPETEERTYSEFMGIPDRPYGLQPDLDPRIREALEALEDEAYVDPDLDEQETDFFEGLVASGEKQGGEDDAVWEDDLEDGGELEETQWEAEMAKYKTPASMHAAESDLGDEADSEGGDTIAELKAASARRPPRKAPSAATGYSMSSSAMFRNKGLSTLDDQFDEVEKMYADDYDDFGAPESFEDATSVTSDDELPEARDDFDAVMDDFLSRFQVLGGKYKPTLEGETPGEKLDVLRREFAAIGDDTDDPIRDRQQQKDRILAAAERQAREKRKNASEPVIREEKSYDTWDCETVLSTYSNLENHPKIIRIRNQFATKTQAPVAQIRIDEKTGFPAVQNGRQEEESSGSDTEDGSLVRETVARPKGESKEERKARKAAVKAERQTRRVEKKQNSLAFDQERKKQKRKLASQKVSAADVSGPGGRTTTINLS
ncbi:uncharacterized protein L969DRAFT_80855 [Mixia osmundae IAM 14324]|nr:uncharacterized protein L969DRAFT_80855 [Mixia osmundae IAM 14324]KEI42131.1 hypothetical protein L969DRAFT_80855 [Mixia osmundae IAM 14324]